jgi:Cd2+/Zn2+-exporting ATPase
MQIARQNVWVALTIKIIVFILGITGIYANMWLAVFADTGVAMLCILNSVRLLYIKVA